MSNPVEEGLLVKFFAMRCETSTFVVPIEFVKVLKELRRLLENSAEIVPVSSFKPEVVDDLQERFPSIERIKLIDMELQLTPLKKALDLAQKVLQDQLENKTNSLNNNYLSLNKVKSEQEDQLEDNTNPLNKNYLSLNKVLFHELLRAAYVLDFPQMMTLLCNFADTEGIQYNFMSPAAANLGSLYTIPID